MYMYDTVLPRCTLDVSSMCAGQIGVGGEGMRRFIGKELIGVQRYYKFLIYARLFVIFIGFFQKRRNGEGNCPTDYSVSCSLSVNLYYGMVLKS